MRLSIPHLALSDVYVSAVRLSDGCGRHSDAVCDVSNQQFSSVCQLLQQQRTVAYHTHCRVHLHAYQTFFSRVECVNCGLRPIAPDDPVAGCAVNVCVSVTRLRPEKLNGSRSCLGEDSRRPRCTYSLGGEGSVIGGTLLVVLYGYINLSGRTHSLVGATFDAAVVAILNQLLPILMYTGMVTNAV